MTKPITSVALLQLYERGLFQLNDPVSAYLPPFKNLTVFKSGHENAFDVEPLQREVTFRDLFTHTAGFTYPSEAADSHPVDRLYAKHQVRTSPGATLASMVDKMAEIPLVFSPGTRWRYSLATDILGYLVEIISGQTLDRYFADHIFEPLGMVDTDFHVPADKVARFAANYGY
jgi:CubicO group peptidase (beta-lactamase class C family)